MIVELVALALGLALVIAGVLLKGLKLGSRIPLTYPPAAPVPQDFAEWAEGIVREGIKRMPNWKSEMSIQIHFCEASELDRIPHYRQTRRYDGAVLPLGPPRGMFMQSKPDAMFISTDILTDKLSAAEAILHELGHIYEFNVYGKTEDPNPPLEEWSLRVAHELVSSPFLSGRPLSAWRF